MNKSEIKIIGRKDRLDFPDLNLENIEVKVDTGAYSSSIHCRDINLSKNKDGVNELSFVLLDPSHVKYHGKTFSTTNFKEIENSINTEVRT